MAAAVAFLQASADFSAAVAARMAASSVLVVSVFMSVSASA